MKLCQRCTFTQLVKEFFSYNSSTGELFRKDLKMKKVGLTVNNKGYYITTSNLFKKISCCKTQLVHRIIFTLHYNFLPKSVDHINGDCKDNRPQNLREADNRKNQLNRHKKVGKDLDLPIGVYRTVRKGRSGFWYEVKYKNNDVYKSTFLRSKKAAFSRIQEWRNTYG